MQQTPNAAIVSSVITKAERLELERRAAAADRSLSGEIRRALRAYLADTKEEQ